MVDVTYRRGERHEHPRRSSRDSAQPPETSSLRVPTYHLPQVRVQAQVSAATLPRFQRDNRTAGTYARQTVPLDFLPEVRDPLAHYLLLHDYREPVHLTLDYPEGGMPAFEVVMREAYAELAQSEAQRLARYLREDLPRLVGGMGEAYLRYAERVAEPSGDSALEALHDHAEADRLRLDDLLARRLRPMAWLLSEAADHYSGELVESPEGVRSGLTTLRSDRTLRFLRDSGRTWDPESPELTEAMVLAHLGDDLVKLMDDAGTAIELAEVTSLPGERALSELRARVRQAAEGLHGRAQADQQAYDKSLSQALAERAGALLEAGDDERLRLAIEAGFSARGIYFSLLESRLGAAIRENVLVPLHAEGYLTDPDAVAIEMVRSDEPPSEEEAMRWRQASDPSLLALKIVALIKDFLGSEDWAHTLGIDSSCEPRVWHAVDDEAYGGPGRLAAEQIVVANLIAPPLQPPGNTLVIDLGPAPALESAAE